MHVRTYIRTYGRALPFSINGVHRCQHEHESEKKCEEQKRIEKHSIRNPSRPNLDFDELLKTLPRKHCYVPQTGRYVKLHFCEKARKIHTHTHTRRYIEESKVFISFGKSPREGGRELNCEKPL